MYLGVAIIICSALLLYRLAGYGGHIKLLSIVLHIFMFQITIRMDHKGKKKVIKVDDFILQKDKSEFWLQIEIDYVLWWVLNLHILNWVEKKKLIN